MTPNFRLPLYRAWTGLILCGESLLASGWRILSWALLFTGLWLLGLPAAFGLVTEWLTLIVFWGGLLYLALDFKGFKWPTARDINARLEQDNRLAHQPLRSLEDTLSNQDNQKTEQLWSRYQARINSALANLSPPRYRGILPVLDPLALRILAVMICLSGLLFAGTDAANRVKRGLLPLPSQTTAFQPVLSVTITPPAYTRRPQIFTENTRAERQPIEIPAGSRIEILAENLLPFTAPELRIGVQSWPLKELENKTYALEAQIPPGETILIKDGFITRAEIPYTFTPDQPPMVSQAGEAEITEDGAVRFPLELLDDYGVDHLQMDMSLDPMIEDAPIGRSVTEKRSVMSPANTEFTIQPVYDLTSHSWAGLPAVFTFTAYDHTGQSSTPLEIALELPERDFEHPVAQALIAIRKKMAWEPLTAYGDRAADIESLMVYPHTYQHDPVVFLALRSMASRLRYADPPSEEIARSLLSLIWDTALRIEDGNLTLAARDLRAAQRALDEALRNPDAGRDEIDRRMAELREKLGEYFRELQREMQKRMAESPEDLQNMPQMPQTISPQSFADFLAEMERAMREGDMGKAREMLSQLQRLLDMVDPSMQMAMPPDMQMMQDGINELQELIDKQKDLLTRTEEDAAKERRFDTSPPDYDGRQTEQESLRLVLGQLMLDAGNILENVPENMGLAEQAMRRSTGSFADQSARRAIPHQEAAIEHLEEAQQNLSQQLTARMQQMIGFAFGGSGQYDPLGRPYGGDPGDEIGPPGSQVEIPDAGERSRTQDIIRMLRERSGELYRPREELDYFERLLERF